MMLVITCNPGQVQPLSCWDLLLSCQTVFPLGMSCFLPIGLHSHPQIHFSLPEKRGDKNSLIS